MKYTAPELHLNEIHDLSLKP